MNDCGSLHKINNTVSVKVNSIKDASSTDKQDTRRKKTLPAMIFKYTEVEGICRQGIMDILPAKCDSMYECDCSITSKKISIEIKNKLKDLYPDYKLVTYIVVGHTTNVQNKDPHPDVSILMKCICNFDSTVDGYCHVQVINEDQTLFCNTFVFAVYSKTY
ncbi:hypothetical protein GJ496_005467 [Pomphorhynchus laevis]|nr:hypothetical protein GJ496_005467 [Pomphorhynchus laevis]